jgi:outer membrane protein assembly factor BamD
MERYGSASMILLRRVRLMMALATLLGACGPKRMEMLTCEEYYQRGMRALEGKKWLKAQENFERVTLNYPGCDLVDDAQYMLGETYFRQDKFIEAQFEFRRVMEDFRLSDRMEDAQYMIALCAHKQSFPSVLDQTPTDEAIFRFQQYLDDFPRGKWSADARRYILDNRKRLAQKDYDTAHFYYRQSYQDAALIYLDHIINEYSDTGEWVERARFLKATILSNGGHQQEALALLRAINLDTVRPRMRGEVERAIARLQEK